MAFGTNVRTYQDITIVQIGTEMCLGRLKSLRERDSAPGIELKAGKETRSAYKPGYASKTISGEAYMTTANFKAAIGTVVGYTHDLGGTTERGSGVLSSREASWATGDAEGETFEIQVCGTPSLGA